MYLLSADNVELKHYANCSLLKGDELSKFPPFPESSTQCLADVRLQKSSLTTFHEDKFDSVP